MKKSLFMITMMLVLPSLIIGGCATSGELQKVQAEQKMIDAKADQALKDAQAAKTAAG